MRISSLHRLVAAACLLALSSCSQQTVIAPPTAEDLRIAKLAMPTSEVSLMLRSGYTEAAIMEEVKRRRISAKPDAPTENILLEAGASAALITALKTESNLLTPTQRLAFNEQVVQRANTVDQQAANVAHTLAAEARDRQQENQRRYGLQQQTLQNIRQREQQQAGYEQADRQYRARKQSLERAIVEQQTQINRLRSNGYREDELRSANQRLADYNTELSRLSAPLRSM